MAASISSSGYQNPGSSTTISFAFTLTAGQTVFIYLNARDGGSITYSSATWNGGAATANEAQNATVADGIAFHRLVYRGLAAATSTLQVTMSGFHTDLAGWYFIIDGADQTTTIGDVDFVNLTSSSDFDSGSVVLTTTTNDLVITSIRVRADLTASMAEDAGQTLIGSDNLTANTNTASISTKAGGAGSTAVGWTWDGSGFPTWAMDSLVIQGTGGGGGSGKPWVTYAGMMSA